MRLVVQRVKQAAVFVDQQLIGQIEKGYLLYVGIHASDTEKNILKVAEKVKNLRIFEDADGKLNLNLSAVNGSILAVSQFTLYGDTKGNNRPSFIEAAKGPYALKLFNLFVHELREHFQVETGMFGEHMEVTSANDGPVTILIDTN